MAYESNITRSGSAGASHKPGVATDPFSRPESDLSADANTAPALVGTYRVSPARAKTSPLPTSGDVRDQPSILVADRGLISPRRALMRRYCPTCRPNRHNTVTSFAVERTQADPDCPSTSNNHQQPVCCKSLPKNHYLTLAAQRGGQADTETVTAERHSQGLIANT